MKTVIQSNSVPGGENKEPVPFLWTGANEEHDENDFGGLFDKRVFVPSFDDGV